MERILLLHEKMKWNNRTVDFLRLSGYEVMEEEPDNLEGQKVSLQLAGAILMECEDAITYSDTCKRLRGLTDKPIMILSHLGEEWEKVKMFQCGADDYLASPYLQTELIARLRAHMECYRRLTKGVGVLKSQDMVINAFTRKVYIREELVALRMKEFDILLYLAQHSGRVVTKEELYQMVWRTEHFIANYSNTVAVHIKRIREQVEDDIENPQYIKTVWGIGYQFINR